MTSRQHVLAIVEPDTEDESTLDVARAEVARG